MSFSEKGDVAHLTEYGLDTVPGQVIDAGQTDAPEPGTLSLLALGARQVGADWSHWTRDSKLLETVRRQLGDKIAALHCSP